MSRRIQNSSVAKRVAITYEDFKKVAPYADALRLVGVDPVLISADEPWSLRGVDGLMITGGRDLDARSYGQERHPKSQEPNPARDRMEIGLLGEALDRDLPVLGICRGLQLFNVYHGGTLIQHIESGKHTVRTADASQPAHQVIIAPNTLLAAILGPGAHPVNSRHHQGVAQLGGHLAVSAKSADDGMVEGLERADKLFAVAVQWHPEDQVKSDPLQKRLFEAFAQAIPAHVTA